MGLFEKISGKTKKGKDKQGLGEQRATPVANSNRDLWSGGLVAGLTPEKLAAILDKVRRGDVPAEYLEIAGELEERDAHYRSVLSTRKHAVEGLELYVQAGGDDKNALAVADAVQEDIISHADSMDLIKNALDALGKGFSVNEIIWDTSGSRWKPETFIYRDPAGSHMTRRRAFFPCETLTDSNFTRLSRTSSSSTSRIY